jgi:alpha-D-ribose 1-methylphosphonate 5-triphosphate diphosphatase
MSEMLFNNAQLVTANECFMGHVLVRDGIIADMGPGLSALPSAVDLEGDLLLPGLVEVHTDNLEKHMLPRPGVLWDPYSATVVHDAQCAVAGITTVLDAVMVGSRDLGGVRHRMQETAIETLQQCREDGVLRVEHLLHLRCEVATADVLAHFERHVVRPDLRMVSVWTTPPASASGVTWPSTASTWNAMDAIPRRSSAPCSKSSNASTKPTQPAIGRR